MIELSDADAAEIAATLSRLEGSVFAAIAEKPVFEAGVFRVGEYEIEAAPFVAEFWPNARQFRVRGPQGGLGNYLAMNDAISAIAGDAVRRFLSMPAA